MKKKEKEKTPTWKQALNKVDSGPLSHLASHTRIWCGNDYPIARSDWAYVTSTGNIYLNPCRDATAGEWEYIISHCLLHLGFEHFREERMGDHNWIAACDLVVSRFLRDSRIGRPPAELSGEFPFPVRDEEQVYRRLTDSPALSVSFSTMTNGRPDMVWRSGVKKTDYAGLLAESLQDAIQNSLREARGLPPAPKYHGLSCSYIEARDWFLSSFPLLGAVASSFRIVDDAETVRRMGIRVAAVCPQLSELYINPTCRLKLEEWKFVLAHEFLHAALRHDTRLEDRIPALWNAACDYVVNSWLVEMNVGLMPEFGLLDQEFKGRSVENVYDMLCADIRRYAADGPGDILYGDDGWWSSLDGAGLDAMYRAAIRQGLIYHQDGKGRGLVPAGMVEEIHAISRPPIRWDVELAKWFDRQFEPQERHCSYSRLSRRQSATPDIPRPAWRMDPGPCEQRIFGVVLDTSGSMDRALLAAALGSIASYSQARDVRHVRVVFCDAAAYDNGIMSPEAIAGAVKVRGRGGTKLQPGIDMLEQDDCFPKNAPVLIITDGECDRLNLRGREHAFLIPWGHRLPFPPKGPVFKLK